MSKFLPNEPISNEEIEDYLGMVDSQPSKAKRLVLRNNGIKSRYYSINRKGETTHTNTEMTARAIQGLLDEDFKLSDMEFLASGTTSPDQLIPSHAAMVHGSLGGGNIEITSMISTCMAGVQALKAAYLSVLAGNTNNAVATGSERLSAWMMARNFEKESDKLHELDANPYIAFDKEFLRWMLSDGAAAALVMPNPGPGISLRIDWLDITSYANELEVCMYAGAIKNANGSTTGYYEYTPEEWLENSIFSLKQDVKTLGTNIVPMGVTFLRSIMEKRNFDLNSIDHFLPHLSSEFFRGKIVEELAKFNLEIPQEKWFTNLSSIGNVGAASALLMLEELFNSGRLKKGETILIMVPESARFSYAYIHLTVC